MFVDTAPVYAFIAVAECLAYPIQQNSPQVGKKVPRTRELTRLIFAYTNAITIIQRKAMEMVQASGERLRAAREDLGLTQEVFAQLLSVPGNTVARWERGLLAPTGAHRKKVEHFLAIMDNPKGKEALQEAIRTGGITSGAGFLGLLGGVMGSMGMKNLMTAAGIFLVGAAVGAGIITALNMMQGGGKKET